MISITPLRGKCTREDGKDLCNSPQLSACLICIKSVISDSCLLYSMFLCLSDSRFYLPYQVEILYVKMLPCFLFASLHFRFWCFLLVYEYRFPYSALCGCVLTPIRTARLKSVSGHFLYWLGLVSILGIDLAEWSDWSNHWDEQK